MPPPFDEIDGYEQTFIDYCSECISLSKNLDDYDEKYHNTLLIAAIERCLENAVSFLLEKGANVDAPNNKGKTPLFYAVDNGYVNICEMLVAKGADVNRRTFENNFRLELPSLESTYLHYACCSFNSYTFERYYKIAEILLKAGAKVNALNTEGQTPFLVLMSSDRIQFPNGQEIDDFLKFKELLIYYGADIMMPDLKGKSPLEYRMFHAEYRYNFHNRSFNFEITKSLLADMHGIEPEHNKRQRID